MAYLVAAFLLALTLPVWGGAIAAIVGAGFMLFFNYPIPMILGTLVLFWLAARCA